MLQIGVAKERGSWINLECFWLWKFYSAPKTSGVMEWKWSLLPNCKIKTWQKGLGRDIHIDANTLEILKHLKNRKINDKNSNNRFHHYFSDRGVITQTKTSRELDFVCVDKYGERLTNNSLERIAKDIRADLGITDFNIHKLRHTHASELYEKGMREKYIGERLGHKNFKITDIYIHPTLESKQSSDKIVESLFETE